MRLFLTYILVLLMCAGNLCAQDSVSAVSLTLSDDFASSDKEKLERLIKISKTSQSADSVIFMSQLGIKLAMQLGDSASMAELYGCLGWGEYFKSNYKNSLHDYLRQYQIASNIGLADMQGKSLLSVACCHNAMGNKELAVGMYKKSLLIFSELGDSLMMGEIFRHIGENCMSVGLFDVAEENFNSAKKIDLRENDSLNLAKDYNYLSNLNLSKYNSDHELYDAVTLNKSEKLADSAFMYLATVDDCFDRNWELAQYTGTKAIIAISYYSKGLGNYYLDSADYYCSKYSRIVTDLSDPIGSVQSNILRARVLMEQGNIELALSILHRMIKDHGNSLYGKLSCDIYSVTSQAYERRGDYKKALEHLHKFVYYNDKAVNENLVRKNAAISSEVKIGMLIDEQGRERDLQNEIIKSQKFINSLVIIALCVSLLAIVVFYVSWRNKRDNVRLLNETNNRLSQKQNEIIAQQRVINAQKNAAERANVETYQSINYAKHIQQAALPSESTIRRIFPDSFVYFQPKDIVSGDWYYVTQNSGFNIFVLSDCTGHGVPGGFLSMLGISTIKELLRNPEIEVAPGLILDMMRNYIKDALANDIFMQNSVDEYDDETFATADGMDMTICAIDPYAYKLKFAGAYQSLYIVRHGEITRLKGDRMPVGRHINEKPNFTTQYYDIQKDDMIYLCSDGIESQIGFTGTKFMTKRLKEFFSNNYDKPCVEQLDNISRIMNEWMFGAIQVDDLSLVGIRIQ